MKKYAIIVAGGSGTRMGGNTPKQLQLLRGKPVLWHTLKIFTNAYPDMILILVLPEAYLQQGEELAKEFPGQTIRVTAGGETRFNSVKKGLALVETEAIIFVHDGVRCLLTNELIHRCYEKAVETGTAVPAIASKDSIRLMRDNYNEAFDRNSVMLIQTPQTFHSKILIPAFRIDYKDQFTDEATVVEAFGMKVSLVEGEEDNIKITRPVDLLIAEKILEERDQQSAY